LVQNQSIRHISVVSNKYIKRSNSILKIVVSINVKNYKHQITNIKWFDKPLDRLTVLSKVEGLTTLSQVEGQ